MPNSNYNIPPDRTRTEAPLVSCIDLINDPCFPIRLMACVDATNNLIEQNAAPDASLSANPLTRLNTLITAFIAGDNGASGSSFPDISTYRKIKEKGLHLGQKMSVSYLFL